MENYFTLAPANNKMEAYISAKVDSKEIPEFTENDILSFLKDKGICFGINYDTLSNLINHRSISHDPLLIAKGVSPISGENGYLRNEIVMDQTKVDEEKALNFRDVLKIPSVKKGELLATIIPPTNGTNGINVFGNEISAKNGRPFKLARGKNIEVIDNSIYAKIDGQISVNGNHIDVFPVFEVKGDLDLKVGNIDFIGNVSIRGDVPDGYHIKAGGDIKVFGVVEGSTLESEGSIYISGGIVGGNSGRIIAKGNVQSTYINHADVEAKLDIEVNGSIMHSKCSAGGKVICKSGSIIGGSISAGDSIIAKEIGSRAYAKTELYIGRDKNLIDKEKELQSELQQCTENLNKLNTFMAKISQKYKTSGGLTTQEIEILKKQNAIRENLEKTLKQLHQELKELHELPEDLNGNEVRVAGIIHPNVQINYGKYRYINQSEQKRIKYFFDHGEIVSSQLQM